MFKSDEICKECGTELISYFDPQYGLCDDCIEAWKVRRDRIDPERCIHGYYKEECHVCIEECD